MKTENIISVTDLLKNHKSQIAKLNDEPELLVMSGSKPAFVMLEPSHYDFLKALEAQATAALIKDRLYDERNSDSRVTLDEMLEKHNNANA